MYLRTRDYDPAILAPNLLQIITNATVADLGIRQIVENYAKGVVRSYLKQKYYTDWELTDTNVYSRYIANTTTPILFYSGSRVELNFAAYVPANTYNIGDTCSVTAAGVTTEYICNTNGTTGTFNPSNWYAVGIQYDLWNVQMPYPLFNVNANYKIGDIRFWKGNLYSCQQATADLTTNDVLDAITISNIPKPNSFPGDGSTASLNQWGIGVPYTFSIINLSQYNAWSNVGSYLQGNIITHNNTAWISLQGTLASPNINNEPGSDNVNWGVYAFNGIAPNVPFNTPWSGVTNYTAGQLAMNGSMLWVSIFGTASVPNVGNIPGADIKNWVPLTWVYGDNRDQVLLPAMVNISLKMLHERIPPKQIPEIRQLAYDDAIKTLKDIAHGEINPDVLQPYQTDAGQTVTAIGITKENNTW